MRLLTTLMVTVMLTVMLTACSSAATTVAPVRKDSPVYQLPGYIRGSKELRADRVIVFIHGVIGDGTSTWTNTTTGAYFPALVSDDHTFDGVDIWAHEFDSPKLRRSYTIDELADHLRKYLNNDNVIANHRQVVFVCHSLGGLIARAYLLKYRDLSPDRVPMIYFFSTPTTGSDLANITRVISANPQLTDMRKMTTDDPGVLGVWEAQWTSSDYARQILSYCAYELLPTYGVYVVQRESARHLCNTRPDPIEKNHIEIAKPANNTTDERYVAFREAYRDTFNRPTESGRAAIWNPAGDDTPLLRVRNVTQTPNCEHTCWAKRGTTVAPGDDLLVAFSYRNGGFATAKDVRLRLDIPQLPIGMVPITGSITGTSVPPAFGSAFIAAFGAPVLLTPTTAWSYDMDPSDRRMLSFTQTAAAALTPDGLRLGDVAPGLTLHHIVLQFHCEPVTLAGTGDADSEMRSLGNIMTQARAGTLPEAKLSQPLTIPSGHIEYDELGANAAWVPDLVDIANDNAILLRLWHYNNSHETLRDLRASITIEQSDSEHAKVVVTLRSRKGIERVAMANLTFRPGTTHRPVLVGVWHGQKDLFKGLAALGGEEGEARELEFPVEGDTIQLGDLPSETHTAAILDYEMLPTEESAPLTQNPAPERTTLNGTALDWPLLQVSNARLNSEWTESLTKFTPGQPLGVLFSFHNRGSTIARSVKLRLVLKEAKSGFAHDGLKYSY
ncbi:MAG: alpha/beta fold hydrolase [Acidobacteriota bacterium]